MGFTNSVAPILMAHSFFPGLVSTAMTREAPTTAAVEMTPRPMAPHPKTATLEPSASTYKVTENGTRKKEVRTDSWLLHDGTPGSCDTTSEETNFIKWRRLVDSNYGNICNDRVLRECRSAHLESEGALNAAAQPNGRRWLTKWWTCLPLQVNRLELSGIRPCPWVDRTECVGMKVKPYFDDIC